jgi:hypothetical protein
MNQVIEDLAGNIQWSKSLDYSIFECLALFVNISGITIAEWAFMLCEIGGKRITSGQRTENNKINRMLACCQVGFF